MDYKLKKNLTSDEKADLWFDIFTRGTNEFNLPEEYYDKLSSESKNKLEKKK